MMTGTDAHKFIFNTPTHRQCGKPKHKQVTRVEQMFRGFLSLISRSGGDEPEVLLNQLSILLYDYSTDLDGLG